MDYEPGTMRHLGAMAKYNKDDGREIKQTRQCVICGKTLHRITTANGHLSVLPKCKCETDLADREEKERLIREKQSRLNDNIAASGLGRRILKCTFDNYRINEKNKDFFEKVKQFADNFKEFNKLGMGLLLCGEPGNGKTHLSASVLKAVAAQEFSTSFVIVADLLQKRKDSIKGSMGDYLKVLQSVDLLVFDDLGRNEMRDFDISFIFSVINSRYNNMKPTVITSNMLPAEWAEKDHGRVYDRLKECSMTLINKAESERGNNNLF